MKSWWKKTSCLSGIWIPPTEHIDRQPVRESALYSGQTLQIGPMQMLLDAPEVRLAIPELPPPEQPFEVKIQPLPDGYPACLNHAVRHAVWECTFCGRHYCDGCIRKLRRIGGEQ